MEDLLKALYATCVTNFKETGNTFTESQLAKDFSALEGDGVLEKQLSELGVRLSDVLSTSRDFQRINARYWKFSVNQNASEIVNTMMDQKKKNKPSRGRGGAAMRTNFTVSDNRRFQRGNSHTHGSSFRPPPTQSFANQRPLQRNGGPGPSQPGLNRNNSYSSNGSNYHQPHAPYRSPPRHYSPPRRYSPSRYSPPRYRSPQRHNSPPSFGSSAPRYRSSPPPSDGYRSYDGERDQGRYNAARSNQGYDDGFVDDRNYGNSYDRHDSRRQSPVRRGFSPQRRYPPVPDYQDHRARSPNRRRRSSSYGRLSPDNIRHSTDYGRRSPSRNDHSSRYHGSSSVYRDDSPDNRRRDDFSRYESPPPPQRGRSDLRNSSSVFQNGPSHSNNVPSSKHNHRNEYPPRPESSLSFSSVEEGTEASRSSSRAEVPLSLPSQMAAIAKTFNAPVIDIKNGKTAKSVAKEVRRYMTADVYPTGVMLEELIAYVEKTVTIPGVNAEEKENYIANLKNLMPDILDELHVDTDDTRIHWGRCIIDENGKKTISTLAEDAKEDELHSTILTHLKNISCPRFSCTETIRQLMDCTGERDEDVIRRKLTYILFEKLKGTYSYVPGSKDLIEQRKHDLTRDTFAVPLVHKFLEDSYKVTLRVQKGRFLNFRKFSVRPVDTAAELESMENEIKELVENDTTKPAAAPPGGWKSNHGCLCKIQQDKWVRGVINKQENLDVLRVYLLDLGCIQLFKLKELMVLPQKFMEIRPYAIPCKVVAEPHVLADLESQHSEAFRKYSDEFDIEITDRSFDGEFSNFIVNVYIRGVNGTRKNIIANLY